MRLLKGATDAGDVPGVVAMATDRNSVLYEGAYGKRILGQAAPMTADTVVWIASMTKALTATAAMQLVEQGKLDLDAPAAKVVPEIASIEVLEGFDASGQPRTRAPKRPITLRHLLTHTAGFGYDLWSVDLGKYQTAKNIPGIITCQNAALRTPLLSIQATGGFTASASIGPARWWRPRVVRGLAPICRRTYSRRSA
jgi:CubicO group peptidase (beta-lactamase class C family)